MAVHKIMLDHLLVCPLPSVAVYFCVRKRIYLGVFAGKARYDSSLTYPSRYEACLDALLSSQSLPIFIFVPFSFLFPDSFSFTCVQLILGCSNLMNGSARADLIDFGLLLITVNEITVTL